MVSVIAVVIFCSLSDARFVLAIILEFSHKRVFGLRFC